MATKIRVHEGDTIEMLAGRLRNGAEYILRVRVYRLSRSKTVLHPVGVFDRNGHYRVSLKPRAN